MPTMTTAALIDLAESHAHKGAMVSSARSCIHDARTLAARGEDGYARAWALRSLTYSVGKFHPDYARAAREVAS